MLGSFTFDEVDMDATTMVVIGTEQLSKKPRCERWQEANRDPTALRSADRGNILGTVSHMPKHFLGLASEPLPGKS
ncbi:hypothetical protein BJF92_19285 [Rhizobium rhizosphaerae]|uniref:Uncharacterized protein n=1 Tax=Xaviernesmea rhizosphaerae TaxID=1672749 RepID=A0A1Q9AGP8_9HYPH|nr:hypothetical protein BJF92_19285 [Xaviernesmea rhizosphaerae]